MVSLARSPFIPAWSHVFPELISSPNSYLPRTLCLPRESGDPVHCKYYIYSLDSRIRGKDRKAEARLRRAQAEPFSPSRKAMDGNNRMSAWA